MKRVLGIDLGTTSIGWAIVNQAENTDEKSSIVRAGVRVNPLTVEEKDSFEKGKAITTNADRTLKRSARRRLQRYKLRREHLVSILKREGWISDQDLLHENGNFSTFQTYRLRAQAASEKISLQDLARVLLMINKKRGYKSSRKVSGDEDGRLIDGMDIALQLYEQRLTPGQLSLKLMEEGTKKLPDFYRSDLENELERIWVAQKEIYPEILTDELRKQISGRGRNDVGKLFYAKYGISTAENRGSEKKINALRWRNAALESGIEKEILAYVIADLCGELKNTSGYLGNISDRSKELYFSKQTIGQYLYSNLMKDPHFRVRGQVFYRKDYLDEFEKIWETQKIYHSLSEQLKEEIRDTVIFYQRRLKSQKSLISFCEFEHRTIHRMVNGQEKSYLTGSRVAPRSSILFQEFKIWQILNNIVIKNRHQKIERELTSDEKKLLAEKLSVAGRMTSTETLKVLFEKPSGYTMNYKVIEGNDTLAALYAGFAEIVSFSGNGEIDLKNMAPEQIKRQIKEIFTNLGFGSDFLEFDTSLPKEEYEQQKLFKLWHLLYSYEGDDSRTGDGKLIDNISQLCHLPKEYARIISKITFTDDYASLSHKAISKILPYLKRGMKYDEACELAGYRHSSRSLTKEEIENKPLVERIDSVSKNSLRNPVVEKILNQMINVINELHAEFGRPDEIHIELARELKHNAEQRKNDTDRINRTEKENEKIIQILKTDFNLTYVSKNDILRYRLYQELKENGYKTLYTNQYIPAEKLFSSDIEIEHIIPQARLFDDSYANKTLEYSQANKDKGKSTAIDYVENLYKEDGVKAYQLRVDDLYKKGEIGKGKYNRLLMKGTEIPDDFVNRDLTDSQYIAKKAKEILENYVRVVVSTNGQITARLREDWQLVDVMKEINLPKYTSAGMTYQIERPGGHRITKISDWSKRDDHRHHAMDAITIAFTRPQHIQYLNNLSAESEKSGSIYGIEHQALVSSLDGKKRFLPPMPLDELRSSFKNELESILVSIKAKNKVATKNRNVTKNKAGEHVAVELTPRGELHKENVYGQRKLYETYEIAVGAKLTEEEIQHVADKKEKTALQERLNAFDGDAKKAFTGKNSLDKNPIYLDELHTAKIGPKVKCVRFKTVYSIRKDLDKTLSVNKVMDTRIRTLLEDRIRKFGGDQAAAFANLDEDPIWLNEEKRIPIRKVTIAENMNLIPIRKKKDGNGNLKDADFVNLRNNHHVAIFEDAKGDYQECIVSLYEAIQRKIAGLPVIDKDYRKEDGWKFQFSMKINEMFVFPNPETGFDPQKIDLKDKRNYRLINPNLFRIQKLSKKDYNFRLHTDTSTKEIKSLINIQTKRITNCNKLKGIVKVRINHIGEIVDVGEYD